MKNLKAHRIGIFLSMPHEINTYNIITFALDNGKQILCPIQITEVVI